MELKSIPAWLLTLALLLAIFFLIFINVTGSQFCYKEKLAFVKEGLSCQANSQKEKLLLDKIKMANGDVSSLKKENETLESKIETLESNQMTVKWVTAKTFRSCDMVCESKSLKPAWSSVDGASGKYFYICRSGGEFLRPGFQINANHKTKNKCVRESSGTVMYDGEYDCLCLNGKIQSST